MVAPPARSSLDADEGLYYPEVEEMRVSPLVSRKGYVNFLEDGKQQKVKGWSKRWVVVRRPYVFIFNSEKDPVERGLINLASAQVGFSEESQALLKVRHATVCAYYQVPACT